MDWTGYMILRMDFSGLSEPVKATVHESMPEIVSVEQISPQIKDEEVERERINVVAAGTDQS